MACAERPETVEPDLGELGSSFCYARPGVFETLLPRLIIRMEDASAIKRSMFHHFLKIARKHAEAILTGKPVPLSGRILYAIGRMLVYEPLKNVLGLSRVRVAYTAGQAIGPPPLALYRSLPPNL